MSYHRLLSIDLLYFALHGLVAVFTEVYTVHLLCGFSSPLDEFLWQSAILFVLCLCWFCQLFEKKKNIPLLKNK